MLGSELNSAAAANEGYTVTANEVTDVPDRIGHIITGYPQFRGGSVERYGKDATLSFRQPHHSHSPC